MRVRFFWPIFALLPVITCSAHAKDWNVYTSENFTVYSDANRGEVTRVLENFEVFRRVILATLDLPAEPENENLRIVVFKRPRDFDKFKPNDDTGGFFYHSVFGPRMMVGPSWSSDYSQRILFHEYVHYLMDQRSIANYPRWYSEGLAEVLEMTEIRNSSAVVGHVRPTMNLNERMSVSEVVDTEFDDMDAGFYYTSWLMTHYLMIDSVNALERRRSTREFLDRYDAGAEPIAAFVDSFGISIEEMQDQIDAYARRSRYTVIEFPQVSYEGDTTQEPLELAEELFLLGDLAVELGEREAAYDYFEQFSELDDHAGLEDNANSRKAIALIHDEEVDQGDALIEALVTGNVADPDVQADIAHYAYDRYIHARTEGEAGARQHLDRAIEFGKRATDANPSDLEALFYLGLAHEQNNELQPAVDSLLNFYDRNPSVTVLNMNLARILIKGNQKDLALYLIARAFSNAHSQEQREEIRRIHDIIAADDFDASTIDRIL